MRHSLASCIGLLVAGFVAAGCATSFTSQGLDDRLELRGTEVRGLTRPRIFPIYAGSRIEAITLLADARNAPRHRISLDLAQQISLARTRVIHFVVGGPYADLNQRVVTNALDYYEDRPLPGLVLVYVSPREPSSELVALARSHRVRMIHRSL